MPGFTTTEQAQGVVCEPGSTLSARVLDKDYDKVTPELTSWRFFSVLLHSHLFQGVLDLTFKPESVQAAPKATKTAKRKRVALPFAAKDRFEGVVELVKETHLVVADLEGHLFLARMLTLMLSQRPMAYTARV